MFPTVQLELIRVVQAERLTAASGTAVAGAAPVTPAHIRAFGPRASRRAASHAGGEVIALPRPREDDVVTLPDRVMLDA